MDEESLIFHKFEHETLLNTDPSPRLSYIWIKKK